MLSIFDNGNPVPVHSSFFGNWIAYACWVVRLIIWWGVCSNVWSVSLPSYIHSVCLDYWNIVYVDHQVEIHAHRDPLLEHCLHWIPGGDVPSDMAWSLMEGSFYSTLPPVYCMNHRWSNSKESGKEITVTIMCSRFRKGWLALKMEFKALVQPSLFEYECREMQG